MKIISLFSLLLNCAIAIPALAAELKKPGPSPSDALFDPSRVIQIEIRLDPKDWLALRISHPVVDENNYISVTERGYEYYRADVSIDGKRVKSVGVRKKGSWGSTVSSRPSLKIKFDEYEKDQAFSGLDMMTLNNCIWDPTKAQQLLAYSFMRQAGADVAFSDSPGSYGKPVPRSVKAVGYLCQRLWELPEVRERYRKEMRRLLAEVWEEKTMRAGLDEAMRLGAPYRKPDLMKPEIGFDQIVEFIEGRRKEVEAELDRPAPDWPEIQWPGPTAAESNRGLPMKVEGSFSAIVAEAMPTNFFGNGSATLEFTVDGQTRKPFTRFGTAAVTKQEFRELTVIQIVAADEAGELRWRLGFRIDPYRMTPGIQELAPFAVWANLIQGERPKLQARWFPRNKGTLELTQVSTNLGDTISGKFKINTTAFEEEKKP